MAPSRDCSLLLTRVYFHSSIDRLFFVAFDEPRDFLPGTYPVLPLSHLLYTMGVYSIGLYVLVSLIRVNYTICTNFFRDNTSPPSTFNVSERHSEQIEVRSKLTTERTSIYVYMYAFVETSNAVDRFLLEIGSRGSTVADHVTTLAIFVNEKLWTASWLRDGFTDDGLRNVNVS